MYIVIDDFMQEVVEQDPAYVVRRFESGKYAVDSDVRSIYLEVIVLKYPSTYFITCVLAGCEYIEWGE